MQPSDGGSWSFTRREDVACPACGTPPLVGAMWSCGPDGCGFLFDTFETKARCPKCEAHFAVTWCPTCGKPSPHRAWYRGASA
jgi:predicted amidophosphoribosyltransferase